jgi:predicted O-methyltransferase YrrM
LSAQELRVNDVVFHMSVSSELYTQSSQSNSFVLGKSQEMVDFLRKQLEGRDVRNIVDLGIYKGGSCVLYNELFKPSKLVALDLQKDEIAPLAQYIRDRGLEARVRPYYRTDQSDRSALRRIYEAEFGSEPLDLVVDDASHLYEPTRASFNFLFPKVRPGGLYVIEDWAWSHWPGDEWQKPVGFFAGKKPLSVLVFEIVMTCASMLEGAVKSVVVTGNSVYIERGYRPLDDDFDVGQSFLSQGRPWGPERAA